MFVPLNTIPGYIPAVLGTFTVEELLVVVIPPYVNTNDPPVPVAVNPELSTNCVGLTTAPIVAPAGMFVPLTGIPTVKPLVLETVTNPLRFVVDIPPTVEVATGTAGTAKLAFPFKVTVVPEIPVTVRPKNADPTSNPAGTLATVTVGLDKLLDVTVAVVANGSAFTTTPFAYIVPEYVFTLPNAITAPADVPAEVSTGLVFPVITEFTVNVFAPFVRNNSLWPDVNRPRTPKTPMVRAALSEPDSNPPLANVSVSVFPIKFTVAAPPFNVSELIVCPPESTGNVALKRTLLVAPAPANDTTCSSKLIWRNPDTGSYTPNSRFDPPVVPSMVFTTNHPPTIPFVFVVNPAALGTTHGFAPMVPEADTKANVAPAERVNAPDKAIAA
jgi:hypothetical protein